MQMTILLGMAPVVGMMGMEGMVVAMAMGMGMDPPATAPLAMDPPAMVHLAMAATGNIFKI